MIRVRELKRPWAECAICDKEAHCELSIRLPLDDSRPKGIESKVWYCKGCLYKILTHINSESWIERDKYAINKD